VPRSWIHLLCSAAFVLPLAGVGDALAQASRPSETLLPDTTQGFFAISNVDVLNKHWDKTQLGHLMADPVMKPFVKDIRRQFDDRWSNVHERLGLTLDDLRNVPGGDVAIALVAPAPGTSALAIISDVAGKLPEAKELLEKATKNQLRRGAKRSELKVEGCPDPVIQFILPESEAEKEAGRSALQGSEDADKAAADDGEDKKAADSHEAPEKPAERRAFYCLTGNLLAVTDNLEIMKGILGRALGGRKDSLANHKPFQVVIARCRKDYGDATPQMRWFIHPLGYAEAARVSTPDAKRRKGKSILEVMRHQGLGAVLGMGGFVDFSSEGYELVHRTAIYAPKPYKKSMKMAVLPNKTEFTPQPWVPGNIATYSTFYFDILNAFDNFGALFDELFGQGEEGVWLETVSGLETDPNGPHINLRKELFAHLGQRVSILTDYQLPITTSSERLLFAIEVKDAQAVAKAMAKLFKNDPTVKRHELNGHVIWEIVGDQSPTPTAPTIEMPKFGDAPAVAPARPFRTRKKSDDEEEEEPPRLLPHAAVTVWEGHLMIASHKDFLVKIVAPDKKPAWLGDEADYRMVGEEIKKLDPQKCVRFFSRTDEEYRPTYELIRQNKMPESESLFARLLNNMFGQKKGVTRRQQIDGRELPDYKLVRRYLGPAGLQATGEPEGWFLKGFTLTK
jgi:hypothetical protein